MQLKVVKIQLKPLQKKTFLTYCMGEPQRIAQVPLKSLFAHKMCNIHVHCVPKEALGFSTFWVVLSLFASEF